MYKTIFFCLSENIQCLFFGNISSVFLCLYNIICHITNCNAPSFRIIGAAFVMCQSGTTAGTRTCCIFSLIFTKPVGNMFQINRFIFHLNCFFNRDDMHTDSGTALRYKWSNFLQWQTGHMFKKCTHFRVGFQYFCVHIKEFRTSRYIHRQDILLLMCRIFPVVFEKSFA